MPEPASSAVVAVVPAALAGERVDRAISTLTGLSRRVAAELIDSGAVSLDGTPIGQRSRKVREGDRLEITPRQREVADEIDADGLTDTEVAGITEGAGITGNSGESVDFDVVYSDEHVIVLDKPAGLVVHHGAGHHGGTLVDGLLARFPDLAHLVLVEEPTLGDASFLLGETHEDPGRPGIVHRLDKGTSGLMVVGRTEDAVASLSEQLSARTAGRQYLALVAGDVVHDEGVVDAAIGRSARMATRMAVTRSGRPARTSYRVLERIPGPPACTLVEATLETGRTHQVRVHMAAIGHPVAGDERYGESSRTMPLMAGPEPETEPGRLFLTAHNLTFDHPTGGRVTWSSPLPSDLLAVLEQRRGPGQAAV